MAKIGLEGVVFVQTLKHLVEDVCLLLSEMDELGDILEVTALLAEFVDTAIEFVDHEAGILECVDVAVNGAV